MTYFTRMPGNVRPSLTSTLSQVWLFEGLRSEELQHIAQLADIRVYQARKIVVAKGDQASEFFVLLRGRAIVTTRGSDGSETAFNVMGPGEVFGEVAILDGQPRSASVTTLERCEMAVIDKHSFHALLAVSPSIAANLLAVLARRMRELTNRMEDRTFLDVSGRLAKQLLWLAAHHGVQCGNHVRIQIKLSQQELGDLIGATRESVNKQLRAWTRNGVVKQERGCIEIADLESLHAACGA